MSIGFSSPSSLRGTSLAGTIVVGDENAEVIVSHDPIANIEKIKLAMSGTADKIGNVRGLAGKRSAVLLANHGPVVAAKDLEAAVHAMEELEETAKLALLTLGMRPRVLSAAQITDLVEHFDLEWEA